MKTFAKGVKWLKYKLINKVIGSLEPHMETWFWEAFDKFININTKSSNIRSIAHILKNKNFRFNNNLVEKINEINEPDTSKLGQIVAELLKDSP